MKATATPARAAIAMITKEASPVLGVEGVEGAAVVSAGAAVVSAGAAVVSAGAVVSGAGGAT